ncbi:MAG TPA: hypothetical protein VK864_17515 [Longimicrobiales bacterium]|nr:hypothetical protein [Longimicrobiales bacterium]
MDHLIVVTHPDPIKLDVRPIQHADLPEGSVALGYYHSDRLVARGVVSPDAVEAIRELLTDPVSLALAATEDDDGNIDARVCLVLPIDPDALSDDEDEEPEEPWKASLPSLPRGIESAGDPENPDRPRLALLPIGNVVRGHRERNHPDNATADLREMLENLIAGRAQDAVQKAIDDLLNSL